MPAGLSKTLLFTHKCVVADYIVAIFYNGTWKENQMSVSLEKAETIARDVHQRTGFVVQVRSAEGAVMNQYGFPVSESDCDESWEEEE
jgi:hypothetical protein